MTYRGGSYIFGQYLVCAMCCVACPFGGPIAPRQAANGPHIVQAPSPYSLRSIASLTFVKGSLCGDPEAMRWEQGVYFTFSIFSCAHLGSSARNLSRRPKWSTYVGSKVIGVKSLCLEGLSDCTIQAKDIII